MSEGSRRAIINAPAIGGRPDHAGFVNCIYENKEALALLICSKSHRLLKRQPQALAWFGYLYARDLWVFGVLFSDVEPNQDARYSFNSCFIELQDPPAGCSVAAVTHTSLELGRLFGLHDASLAGEQVVCFQSAAYDVDKELIICRIQVQRKASSFEV